MLDTVICDIRMPKSMASRPSNFQREYPHVPLIILTAYPKTAMAVPSWGMARRITWLSQSNPRS